ncbi:hypothetical protein B0T16DRAFT_394744 [Cercophora newfieldiana]|uniref:RING-type domain-containing protein n=1 Tax=Cercophora newfieldiana TaxID=92897 RepID=A0AA39XRK4_9PEZI|nr:hypothetical protein B0T16DRAFT_394744 [Cercophora newfieldiana]
MTNNNVFEEHTLWHYVKQHVLNPPEEWKDKHPQAICSICCDQIQIHGVTVYKADTPFSQGVVLPCGHMFTETCIQKHMTSGFPGADNCPTCRHPLTFSECGCFLKLHKIPVQGAEHPNPLECSVPPTNPELTQRRDKPTTCSSCAEFYAERVVQRVIELAQDPSSAVNGSVAEGSLILDKDPDPIAVLAEAIVEISDLFYEVRATPESLQAFIDQMKASAERDHVKGWGAWEACRAGGCPLERCVQEVFTEPMNATLHFRPLGEPPFMQWIPVWDPTPYELAPVRVRRRLHEMGDEDAYSWRSGDASL